MAPTNLAETLAIAMTILAHGAAIGCGLIFLVAGAEKLRHRRLLPGVIANYRIVPAALAAPLATLLGPLEIVLALALMASGLGWNAPLADFAAATLLLVFAAAMAINLVRGRREITCGCGRLDLRQTLRWSFVARNLLLAALLCAAGANALHAPSATLDALALTSAVFAGLAGWIAYHLFQTLGELDAAAATLGRRH